MVIDVFSKYGWIIPIKNKQGETVTSAFKTIKNRKPQKLWVDKGKEFYNRHFKDMLDKNNIQMYSTENEEKSSVVERWNRTIKNRMWKRFTEQSNTQYLKILPEILNNYNNSFHTSIKMTPTEASQKKNEKTVRDNLYNDLTLLKMKSKYKIGDKVRISKYKRDLFDKGYTPNWTEKMFVIDKIQHTNPVTYKIKDLNDEEIHGSFYEAELQKTDQTLFRVEKVVKKSKTKAYVKWKRYNDSFNSWIPIKALHKLYYNHIV